MTPPGLQDLGVPATPVMVLDLAQTLNHCGRCALQQHVIRKQQQS
jgi:hypothetical protein